jgi:hypothetical protein
MLFDIRRESVDTRGISEYLNWAKELIEIFPNIIIFHNGSVDLSLLKLPTINLIQVDLDQLSINQRRDEIEEICKSYLFEGKEDLVYKLPDYGIVVASKFELLDKARLLRAASYYLWVDIGLTRFLDMESVKKKNFLEINDLNRSVYFEVDLRRNLMITQFLLQKGLLRIPNIGSSRRVIGTGSFLVKSDYVSQLNKLIKNLLDDWIDNSFWDTEQVALGHLIRQIPNLSFHTNKRNSPTSFLQSLSGSRTIRAKPRIWMKILLGPRYQ